MGKDDARDAILGYRDGLQEVLGALPIADVQAVIGFLRAAYEEDKQVFVVGNGGSAATASHMVCDLQKTILGKTIDARMKRFRVLALTDNMPLVTAWGNDVSYDVIFGEQLRNLANPGDLLVVITGSGNSRNILEAVWAAREMDMHVIGLLGFDGGMVADVLDRSVVVRCDNYGYIEDMHMILVHLVTQYFKQTVLGSDLTSRLYEQPLPAVRASQ